MREHRPLLIAITAVLLAGLVFSYFYWSAMRRRAAKLEAPQDTLAISAGLEEPESQEQTIELLVYQSTPRNPGRPYEHKVEVQLATSTDSNSKARQIVNAALNEMADVIPSGSVEQVYLLESGLAVVDFSRDVASQIKGGAVDEYAILLTLTRSLMNNLEGIKEVRFLVGGIEQPTLAGHISLATTFR